jgi:hypothetical protein
MSRNPQIPTTMFKRSYTIVRVSVYPQPYPEQRGHGDTQYSQATSRLPILTSADRQTASAVNRKVHGSNPCSGANFRIRIASDSALRDLRISEKCHRVLDSSPQRPDLVTYCFTSPWGKGSWLRTTPRGVPAG